MTDLAQTLLEESEGRVTTAYRDTQGFLTIGIGCCVDPRVRGCGLCDDAIDAQFAHDSKEARSDATDLPGFERCNDVQQAVLVSMCFQLGDLRAWPDFKAALAAGDMEAAYAAGRASKWYEETPNRAERELQMLKTGSWIANT